MSKREDEWDEPHQDVGYLIAALRSKRERVQELEAALRLFVEAWWGWEGGEFEPLDAAAGQAIDLLGDTFALASQATEEQ